METAVGLLEQTYAVKSALKQSFETQSEPTTNCSSEVSRDENHHGGQAGQWKRLKDCVKCKDSMCCGGGLDLTRND
ncbi:hypothetical protein ScPMuIL_004235 [Solemya velum]